MTTTNAVVANKPVMNLAVNRLTKQLIAAGILGDFVNVVTMEVVPQPKDYVLWVDDKADMKVLLSSLQTMYCSVVGAGLREQDGTTNLFDASTASTFPKGTSELEDRMDSDVKLMTYEEAQRAAAIGYQVALSLSRHAGNEWARGFVVTDITKDGAGLLVPESRVVSPLRTFDEWLIDSLATAKSDTTWFASLVKAKHFGLTVPHFVDVRVLDKDPSQDEFDTSYDAEGDDEPAFRMEIHMAQEQYELWLDTVPYTRDQSPLTRKERIIGRLADHKWATLKQAVQLGNKRAIEKALGEWSLLAHSPAMHEQMASIMKSATYQMHVLSEDLEAQSEQLGALEFAEEHAKMREQLAEQSKLIASRMAALKGETVAPVKSAH